MTDHETPQSPDDENLLDPDQEALVEQFKNDLDVLLATAEIADDTGADLRALVADVEPSLYAGLMHEIADLAALYSDVERALQDGLEEERKARAGALLQKLADRIAANETSPLERAKKIAGKHPNRERLRESRNRWRIARSIGEAATAGEEPSTDTPDAED